MDRLAFIRSKLSKPATEALAKPAGMHVAVNPEEAARKPRRPFVSTPGKRKGGPQLKGPSRFLGFEQTKWFKKPMPKRQKVLGKRNNRATSHLTKFAHVEVVKVERVPPWQKGRE